jgi:hypothetical protein
LADRIKPLDHQLEVFGLWFSVLGFFDFDQSSFAVVASSLICHRTLNPGSGFATASGSVKPFRNS